MTSLVVTLKPGSGPNKAKLRREFVLRLLRRLHETELELGNVTRDRNRWNNRYNADVVDLTRKIRQEKRRIKEILRAGGFKVARGSELSKLLSLR